MDRRAFLKNCLAVGAGCAFAGSATSIAGSLFANKTVKAKVLTLNQSPKTNILFFFADDMRFSMINALGIEGVITPALDSFVQNGVTFKNNFVMGSYQGAVCQPSRAMMLSGRNIFSLTSDGGSIPASNIMIQETMQTAGYNTFVSGKWHNGQASAARGFTVAKNVFFGGMHDPQESTPVNTLKDGSFGTSTTISGIHSSELFANTAIEFLESQRTENKPFFAYIPFKAPHDPRHCPQQYMDMYNLPNGDPDPAKVKLPPNYARFHPYAMNSKTEADGYFDNGELNIRDENLIQKEPRVDSQVLGEIRDYYGITTHLDVQIGRVVAKLNEIGQTKNTIIIFAADNGLAIGQHALLGKQNVYRHSSGVPLIFSGKGIQKGKTTNSFSYLFDIYPTICQLIGAPIPGSVQGLSLTPMLTDQTHVNRPTMYFLYREFQRAVLETRYKLIEYNVNNVRHTQLYDMLEDPWEKNNLAANPSYATKVAELRTEMIRFKNEYNDTGSFWNGF